MPHLALQRMLLPGVDVKTMNSGKVKSGLGKDALAQGAYDSIATVIVPSGGLASITFAGIPNGYEHLQLRCFANITTADSAQIRFNNDSGSNYNGHRLYGNGSGSAAATVQAAGGSSTNIAMPATAGFPSAASTFGVSIIDILNYSNTTTYKTVRGLSGWDGNGSGYVEFGSGLWRTTDAITLITYTASSGSFIANSQFALYGVK